MYTDLSKKPIYDNTAIGFSADFFSPLNRGKIASKLSEALRKRVRYGETYKSGSATAEGINVYPNFYGGFKMNTVESGPMPYNEGLNVLLKTLNAIDEFGFTNKKCKMKLRVWQDGERCGVRAMEHLSIPKFMLGINEAEILGFWKKFNSDKVYRSSLKYVYPKNVFMTAMGPALLENASMTSMRYPSSRFFGVGFENIREGYVELRYVSGANYQRKKQQVVEILNSAVENTYGALEGKYTDTDRNRIAQVVDEQRKVVESMKTYADFSEAYPLIQLFADLKINEETLTQRFPEVRGQVFDLVVYGGMRAGKINIDSANKRLQVRDTQIRDGFSISGVDFFECKVGADLDDCGFQSCVLRGSSIRNSAFYSDNEVRGSAVFECAFVGGSNRLIETYVDNGRDKPIEADITMSIIRRGVVTMNSTVDAGTEMVEAEILDATGK